MDAVVLGMPVIMLRVLDPDRVAAFYEQGLGLACIERAPGRLTQLLLPGATVLEIGRGGDPLPIPPDRSKSPCTVMFEVADIDRFVERLDALGGTVVNPPFESAAGGRMAYIADPEGRLIGLTTGVQALVDAAYARAGA